MIIVTGAAGFIGSAIVWALNERGKGDILVVDSIDPTSLELRGAGHNEKEHNLAPLGYEQIISGDEFRQKLREGYYDSQNVEGIIHMGAISATTEQDWEKLEDNNIEFTQEVVRWSDDHDVRCVYASSGATYGDGGQGYDDDHELFDKLEPLNLYGKSKLLVDIWARDGGYLDKVAGLRYFNVFGPNEYHKEHMRSVVVKKYDQLKEEGIIELFKSNSPEYKDGQQMRDFLYVKDAVSATLFFFDHPKVNGVFNIGTGEARTWNDVAKAMFAAVDRETNIQYVDLPEEIKDQYQNYTQADITKLRGVGYKLKMTSVEDAVKEYLVNYLDSHKHLGET